MEPQKPINHIVAGLIISGVLVVYILLINMLGLGQDQSFGWIAYLVIIGALIFFIRQYGKFHDYRLSFGNLFSYGFKITSIVTLIVIIFMVIMFSIFPEFKEKILDASRLAMEDQNRMSDSDIDRAMEMIDRNFVVVTAGSTLFMYLLLGVIGSLIGAAVTKKQPQNPFEQR